ncbi:MAG TPA: ATPase, T2SS/T4P/T4SS family [Coriobacteriia bacterium]|nr:ATPase, T2SS/T4P/T4SS family [Coriobacteriia bacterium]
MSYRSERIGQLLLSEQLITQEQLDEALRVQSERGGKLGEVLVRELILAEDQIAEILAEQKDLPHVNLAAYPVDPAVALMLPLGMTQRRGVMPLRVDGGKLVMAMADPLDVEAIDEAELLTGMKVSPVVAAASQVRFAIEKFVAGGDTLLSLQNEMPVSVDDDVAVDDDYDVPVVRLVNQLIRAAARENASDIHIEPAAEHIRVRYRVDGVLREAARLPKAAQRPLLSRIKIMADLDITERRRPQDGRISIVADGKQLDLRVATLPTPDGESITIRLLDAAMSFHALDDVGLTGRQYEIVSRMLKRPWGAVLVSGPTGSGKSTTMYAAIHEINDVGKNIITVEDPIEFRMEGVTQTAVNPKVGYTFAAGLRTMLRSDPDVVLVGEVRDPETAEIAVRAALTGHLVITSIHTNDAPSALTRLNDMGVPPYITSSALVGVVAQRLVRKLCERCKKPVPVAQERLRAVGFGEEELGLVPFEAVGCPSCNGTGYRGRTGVFEIMNFSEEMATLYLRNASADELRAQAIAEGMRPLRRDALDRVIAGITSLDEVERVVV